MRFANKILSIIFLSVVFVVILMPICINNLFYDNYDAKEARIDMLNAGDENNQIILAESISGNKPNFARPSWFKNQKIGAGQGSVFNFKLSSKWKKSIFKIKAVNSGELTIFLRGPNKADDNKKAVKIDVDYKNFSINNKIIFAGTEQVWHDKPYINKLNVKDGEILTVSIEYRQPSLFKNFIKHIDVKIFIMVVILSFLASYKIVEYLAKFKTRDNCSRVDIIFLVIFFALLFVPMLKINQKDKSEQENRMLAKYVPLLSGNELNYRYGEQFEKWFNDRFNGRDTIVANFAKLKFKLSSHYRNKSAYIGDDNWLFNVADLMIEEPNYDKLLEQFLKFQSYCDSSNIKCYMLLAPTKGNYYDYGYWVTDNYADIAVKLKNRLENRLKIPTIVPFEELREGVKNDYIYFKTDHHWTDYGAYLAYQSLMKEIKRDFPDINAVTPDDYDIFYNNQIRADSNRDFFKGHTCNLLNLEEKYCFLDIQYKYYKHKNEQELITNSDVAKQERTYFYENGFDKRVVVLGNSFVENLMEFVPYSFKHTLKLRANNQYAKNNDTFTMSRFIKELQEFKPDILVLVLHSNSISALQNMYP